MRSFAWFLLKTTDDQRRKMPEKPLPFKKTLQMRRNYLGWVFFPVCTCRRSCYVVYYQRDVRLHGRAFRLYLGAKIHVFINVLTFGGGVCTPSTSGRVKLWNSYLCRLNLCNSLAKARFKTHDSSATIKSRGFQIFYHGYPDQLQVSL